MIADLRDRHRERKHFARAAFVRTTGVSVIPSTLQRLHGFGYNGIVRIHLSTWLVLKLEGSVHSVPRDVTLPLALPIHTSLLGRFRSSNDDEVAARLSQVTLQEVEDGSLLPGVPLDEVPHDVVVSPRFPVIQGPKLRAIDDMSASMINATVGSREKLQFYDIPCILAVAREFCNASGRPLHGRSFDMQNAYRQIPVLPAHRMWHTSVHLRGGLWPSP